MKVVVLYRPNSEYSRKVEDFAKDLEREHRARIDLVSLDTRDGLSTASLYDIMQNPAILILREDGQIVKEWEGTNLPLKSEVAYYAQS